MPISVPAPKAVNGDQLAAELAAAGFADVEVVVVGEYVEVAAAGVADEMPPGEARDACRTQAELDALVRSRRDEAASANASAAGRVRAVVATHKPAGTL
jgi:hypothetical protein